MNNLKDVKVHDMIAIGTRNEVGEFSFKRYSKVNCVASTIVVTNSGYFKISDGHRIMMDVDSDKEYAIPVDSIGDEVRKNMISVIRNSKKFDTLSDKELVDMFSILS